MANQDKIWHFTEKMVVDANSLIKRWNAVSEEEIAGLIENGTLPAYVLREKSVAQNGVTRLSCVQVTNVLKSTSGYEWEGYFFPIVEVHQFEASHGSHRLRTLNLSFAEHLSGVDLADVFSAVVDPLRVCEEGISYYCDSLAEQYPAPESRNLPRLLESAGETMIVAEVTKNRNSRELPHELVAKWEQAISCANLKPAPKVRLAIWLRRLQGEKIAVLQAEFPNRNIYRDIRVAAGSDVQALRTLYPDLPDLMP